MSYKFIINWVSYGFLEKVFEDAMNDDRT